MCYALSVIFTDERVTEKSIFVLGGLARLDTRNNYCPKEVLQADFFITIFISQRL